MLAAAGRGPCACGGGCPRCAAGAAPSPAALEREADAIAQALLPASAAEPKPEAEAPAAPNGGAPLPEAERRWFEPRLGVPLGAVRIQADRSAADAARARSARAYARGDTLVFGAGEYAPDTPRGRRLLAHEIVHVAQQRSGAAPALQRKEVPDDASIQGKQDWTTADRLGDTQRWQDACLTNLNAIDSSQYQRIVERRDFYKWFYEYTASQGYETRWALAATVVANGAHQIADIDEDFLNALANEELNLASVQLRGDLREGNQVIFDNVLPKLKKLVDGGKLTGTAALAWDMQVLAEEQTLIQPLYAKMSKDSLAQLDDIARQSGVLGYAASATGQDQIAATPHSKGGTVPAFGGSDITDIGERWKYGMLLGKTFAPGGTAYDPATGKMPAVGKGYADGGEFAKVDTRPALHQLDAWLLADADTRSGSGSSIDTIIGSLSEADKERIVSSRGPGDTRYAPLFADAKAQVTPAQLKKALPTDPKFAQAVAQFWQDYALASRSVLDDLKGYYDTGKALWNAGESLYDTGKGLFQGGEDLYEAGKDAYKSGESLYDAGKSVYDLFQ